MNPYRSPGEVLYGYVQREIVPTEIWRTLSTSLTATGRGDELANFFHGIAAMSVVGRIIKAGEGLAEAIPVDGPEFKNEFRGVLQDVVVVERSQVDDLSRLGHKAVSAAVANFTVGQKRRCRSYAERKPNCYICGTDLLFDRAADYRCYTADHVWPQAFGGDSEPENLLPACASCNNEKKQDIACWQMAGLQGLFRPPKPSHQRLQEVHGQLKFALLLMTVTRLANTSSMSLREAFIQHGPWRDVGIMVDSMPVDFFNLGYHS